MQLHRSLSICLGLALGLAATANAWAQDQKLDKRFYIAPMATYGFFDSDSSSNNGTFNPDDQFGASLAIGKPLASVLNVEAYGFYFDSVDDQNSSQSGNVYGYGLDALLFPARQTFPIYGILGIATGKYDKFNGSPGVFGGGGDGDADYLDAGVGYMLKLNHYGLAIRAEYRFRDTSVELNNSRDLHMQDNIVSLGLQVPLGAPPAEPEPEPVAAAPAPAPEPQDSDGDGVNDPSDDCPGTPPGTEVNAQGCPVEKKAPIVLKGVHFEFDSDKLTADAEQRLDNVVNALKGSQDIDVRIEGYTDSKGSDSYNRKLSDERAASVRKYLVDHGISADRLTSKGFGETHPVAPNTMPDGSDNPAGRAKNRRVELHVTNQ